MRSFFQVARIEGEAALKMDSFSAEFLETIHTDITLLDTGDFGMTDPLLEIVTGDLFAGIFDISLFGCRSAPVHTDDLPFDFTLGLVFHGNHYGFTGANQRNKFLLQRGVIYLLNNKVHHGVFPVSQEKIEPLVVVAVDFPAESMMDAYQKVFKGRRTFVTV